MKHTKTLAVLGVVLAVSAFGVTQASAFGPFAGNDTMTKTFAEKLGVSEDKVKQVFTEFRAEHQKEMRSRFEERLNQAVKDGKVTDTQKTLILNKHRELQEKRNSEWQSFQSLTPDERRTKRQSEITELENWAKQNGIDLSWFRFGLGMKGRHMMGR